MEIYLGSNLGVFIEGGLSEALETMGKTAWQSALPSVVVTPNPAINNMIRKHLSEQGVGLMGVEFVRPDDLRSVLSEKLLESAPEANIVNLAAIMRDVATSLRNQCPENRTFLAMSTAPDFLLDTVLLLASGGWNAKTIPSEDLRQVAEGFMVRVDQLGLKIAPQYDLRAQMEAQRREPVFNEIAMVGFDASYWEIWGLLSASALSAKKATVWLPDWSTRGEELEMVWFSSWEHLIGSEIIPLEGETGSSRLECIAECYESSIEDAEPETLIAPIDLRVEDGYGEMAKSVVGEILSKVETGVERICVAVPSNCFVGRSISKILCELEVEHFYAEGNRKSGVGESGAWDALLKYLETEEITFLKAFFQALPTVPKGMTGKRVTTAKLVRALERFRDEVITDQSDVIISKLEGSERKTDAVLLKFIRSLKHLPFEDSIKGFCGALESVCQFLGWNERASMVKDRGNSCRFAEGTFHRAVFLSWIADSASLSDRSDFAGKAYAPIQIVPLDGAHLLEWDHVVLVGVNEGVFPMNPEYPAYISVSDLKALNDRVKELNRYAITGSEDDAHVIPGHALCLSPMQIRVMQGRNFSRILRNSQSISLYAIARDETNGGTEMFPSEVFSVCYSLKHGTALKQEHFQRITGTGELYSFPNVSTYPHSRVEEFKTAKALRENPTGHFSEYEFSIQRPNHGVRIAASDWSLLNKVPELVFLKRFLGVVLSSEGDEFQWERAIGTWAHRILSQAIGSGAVLLPKGDEWRKRIINAGNQLREDFKVLAENSASPAPGWLDHLVSQSISLAVKVAGNLGDANLQDYGYTHVFSEWQLDESFSFEGDPIACYGSLDLLLTNDPESIKGAKVAVFDMKTGKDSKLSVKGINKGDGTQIVSYGLGLSTAGAVEVAMGIITQGGVVAPQVTLEDLEESMQDRKGLGGLLKRLAHGDFGHKGTIRDDFSFFDRLPLATIPVKPRHDATFASHA